jgi:hypothetical protein
LSRTQDRPTEEALRRWCIKGVRRVKVSVDGRGVVSHAGVGMLREMAESTGLVRGVTNALLDTYRGLPVLVGSGPFREPKQQRSTADLAGVVDLGTDHSSAHVMGAVVGAVAAIKGDR